MLFHPDVNRLHLQKVGCEFGTACLDMAFGLVAEACSRPRGRL